MKKIYASLDLNTLAETLISKIESEWKDPFVPPAIIFSDRKTEQWFKQFWMKKSAGKILMNIKFSRIEAFTFNLIASKEQQSKVKYLEGSLFRDLLISKLISKTGDGKYYFESLNSREVNDYLLENGKLNEIKLFDFANEMAYRFSLYEFSRPDSNGKDGAIKCWSRNENYFSVKDESLAEMEKWQRKLYNDALKIKIQSEDAEYTTLFNLLEKNKEANGGELKFYWNQKQPVFLFGFNGVGQIYRNILEDFSREFDLYIFSQSCDEAHCSKNEFLNLWEENGSTNLKLYGDNPEILKREMKCENFLQKVQQCIIDNKSLEEEKIAWNEKDSSVEVVSAPSKIREVEALHTEICKLLSSGEASLSDILVMAPDMEDYKIDIFQVFDENIKGESNFPAVPFNIADYSASDSMVSEAVEVLVQILKKKYFSRSDFFSIARNTAVKCVRGINDEQLDDWSGWIDSLNVFRDRENVNDWDKAENRLLLSRLTDENVSCDAEDLIPFSAMKTEDNDFMFGIIDLIDDLQSWTEFSSKESYSEKDMNEMQALLDKFLLLPENLPDYLHGENFIYENVSEEIKQQILLMKTRNEESVSAECFCLSLSDAVSNSPLSRGTVFTNGISFISFKPNRILTAPYIFILGMNADKFPGTDHTNVLDLRREKLPGDDSIPAKNKTAFLCALMAAGKKFYISYINRDLKTDTQYYCSSVVEDFKRVLKIKERSINIDEDRSWNELFTSREMRNKDNILALKNAKKKNNGAAIEDKASSDYKGEKLNPPDRVTVSKLKSYLYDPFQFVVGNILDTFENDENTEDQDLEPVFLDGKESIAQNMALEKTFNPELDYEVYRKSLKDENYLPDGKFGENEFEEIKKSAEEWYSALSSINAEDFVFEDSVSKTFSQTIEDENGNSTEKEWLLSGAISWHNENYKETGKLQVLSLTSSNYMNQYVTALCLAAKTSVKESDVHYEVTLSYLNKNGKLKNINMNLSGSEAYEIITEIYFRAYVEKYQKCVPFRVVKDYVSESQGAVSEFIKENPEYAENPTDELKEKLEQKLKEVFNWDWYVNKLTNTFAGALNNFNKFYLFEDLKEVGFTEKDFANQWPEECNKHLKVLKFLKEGK